MLFHLDGLAVRPLARMGRNTVEFLPLLGLCHCYHHLTSVRLFKGQKNSPKQ